MEIDILKFLKRTAVDCHNTTSMFNIQKKGTGVNSILSMHMYM